jgi:hypothetical protein
MESHANIVECLRAEAQETAIPGCLIVSAGEQLLSSAHVIAQWIDVHVHQLLDSEIDPKREGSSAERPFSGVFGVRLSEKAFRE